MTQPGGYVTAAELAEIVGVDPQVIRYHAREGVLAGVAIKPGRDWLIPAEDAAAFAEQYEPYGSLRGPRGPRDGGPGHDPGPPRNATH